MVGRKSLDKWLLEGRSKRSWVNGIRSPGKGIILVQEEVYLSSEMGIKQEIEGKRRYRKCLRKDLSLSC